MADNENKDVEPKKDSKINAFVQKHGKKKLIIGTCGVVAVIVLIVGLSVGLTTCNKGSGSTSSTSSSTTSGQTSSSNSSTATSSSSLACTHTFTSGTLDLNNNKTYTSKCTKCGLEYSGTYDESYPITNILYGYYPQSRLTDNTKITELENTFSSVTDNQWCLSGDTYYVRISASPYDSYNFDDGTSISSGTKYWFVCDPVSWKVLSNSDGKILMLSENVLTSCIYSNGRTSVEKYSNNYADSYVRSYINGDLYNTIFSAGDKGNQVLTTTVDNSASTMQGNYTEYACENTNDKVFLLSYQDYVNTNYGFSSEAVNDDAKLGPATEYMRATGSICDKSLGTYYSNYWTRSPYMSSDQATVFYGGSGSVGGQIYNRTCGVRPAVTITLNEVN